MFPLAIVLSVLLRFTDSDFPFSIFKLFIYQLGGHIVTLFKTEGKRFLEKEFFIINWKTVVMSSLTLYSPNVISGVRWRVLIRKPCVILKQNL